MCFFIVPSILFTKYTLFLLLWCGPILLLSQIIIVLSGPASDTASQIVAQSCIFLHRHQASQSLPPPYASEALSSFANNHGTERRTPRNFWLVYGVNIVINVSSRSDGIYFIDEFQELSNYCYLSSNREGVMAFTTS